MPIINHLQAVEAFKELDKRIDTALDKSVPEAPKPTKKEKWQQFKQNIESLYETKTIQVDPNKDYSPSFQLYRHGQNIKKSVDPIKQNQLAEALQKANYDDPVFSDHQILEIAASLNTRNKIHWMQMQTINNM